MTWRWHSTKQVPHLCSLMFSQCQMVLFLSLGKLWLSISFALSTPWLLSWSSISVHCTSYKLLNSKQSFVAPSAARPPVDWVGLHQAYLFPFNFCSLKKFIYRITDLLLFKIKKQFHLWIIVCVGLLFWVSIDLIDLKVFQLLKSKSLFA